MLGNVDKMKDTPRKRRPNPRRTSPNTLRFCPFIIVRMNPAAISGYVTYFISMRKPNRAIIQVVKDAPMFAPIMTRMAWLSASTPALTKLTTITVAALDDSAIVVMQNPDRILLTGFFFIQGRNFWSLSPDSLRSPLLSILRP